MTKPKAKPLTLEQVVTIIEWWQKKLCLEHWTLKVCITKLDNRAMRTVRNVPYREAMVKVDPRTLRLQTSEVWRVAGHEMGHLIIAPIGDQIVLLLGEGIVRNMLDEAEETAVDGLTTAITRLVRMPAFSLAGIPSPR